MKVKKIKLTNFRSIDNAEFNFVDSDNNVKDFIVLIGDNGTGKTAILESITKAFVPVVRTIDKEAVKESDLNNNDIQHGKGFTDITITIAFDDRIYTHTNRRKTKDGTFPLRITKDTLKQKYNECFESGFVPLVLYYGTDRVVRDIPVRGHIKDYKIEHALKNCFNNASYFRDFYDWFKTEEDVELREQRDNHEFKNRKLECVRIAIEKMIPKYDNLRIKLSPSRMVVTDNKGQDLRIEQLSDGYKAILSMVSDIAKRLAIANPQSEEPLNEEAIILIDELDLHLHPKWQRNIVGDLKRTFPNCQFIVSTHSPFIIQSLNKEEVLRVDDEDTNEKEGSYEGWSIEEIQENEMGVAIKTDRYNNLLDMFSRSVDDDDLDKVKGLYKELVSMIHPGSPQRKIIDMDMKLVESDD